MPAKHSSYYETLKIQAEIRHLQVLIAAGGSWTTFKDANGKEIKRWRNDDGTLGGKGGSGEGGEYQEGDKIPQVLASPSVTNKEIALLKADTSEAAKRMKGEAEKLPSDLAVPSKSVVTEIKKIGDAITTQLAKIGETGLGKGVKSGISFVSNQISKMGEVTQKKLHDLGSSVEGKAFKILGEASKEVANFAGGMLIAYGIAVVGCAIGGALVGAAIGAVTGTGIVVPALIGAIGMAKSPFARNLGLINAIFETMHYKRLLSAIQENASTKKKSPVEELPLQAT